MNNKISAIIPTYNSEKYIVRTLESICNQSILPNEIVIVDDGSTDRTIEIINNYVMAHREITDRVKIFQQLNAGAGAARNKAIKEATGEWIAFLDSDDIWDEKKIQIVAEEIDKHPQSTIFAHDEYAVNEDNLNAKRLCELHKKYNASEDLFLQLYRGNLFSTSCMVISRSILEKTGGFDESLRSAQDYDLWIRCSMYGKLHYIEKPLETYVVREGNITSNTYRRYVCEMRICRKYIAELKKRYGETSTQKIVRKRVFMIHKVETYISLTQKKVGTALIIFVRLIPELIKKV